MRSFRQGIFIAAAVVMILVCVALIFVKQSTKEKEGVSGMEIYTEKIEKLVFEAGACRIEIKEGETDEVVLAYEGIRAEDISGKLENDTLRIKCSHKNKWGMKLFGIRFGNEDEAKISLTLPKNRVFQSVTMEFGAAQIRAEKICAEDLTLTVGAGEMSAEYLLGSKSAKISVGAGSLKADEVNLVNADLDCGVGELKLIGEVSGDSTVDCGVGSVVLTLTGQEDAYRGSLDCGLGSLRFGDNSINGSGKREYGTASAENRMDIKCGVGEVDVRFR